jgi:hypothetical protein
MGKKARTPFPINDDVDRALLQVHKAACTLVEIAAARRDVDYVIKAARALADLGTMAAVPVAAVIDQIPSAARRRMMVNLLRDIPPFFGLDVPTTLMRLAANDPSERVREAASETFHFLRRHSSERFERLGALEASQDEIIVEEKAVSAE